MLTLSLYVVPSLHEPRYQVTVDIQNVGGVYGCEVPQLYLGKQRVDTALCCTFADVCESTGFPEGVDQPPKVLKGFTRFVAKVPAL